MIGPVLNFDDLRRISRLGDKAKISSVERWARRIGLRYNYDARGGIWTTVAAMDAAVGVTVEKPETYRPEMVI